MRWHTGARMVLAATLVCPRILAQTQAVPPKLEKRFSRLDTNRDGRLSLEELIQATKNRQSARLEKRFRRWDRDNDGTLSLEEFAAARRRAPEQSSKQDEARRQSRRR